MAETNWRPADIIRTYVEWSREGRVVSCEDLADHYGVSIEYVHSMLHNERMAGYIAKNYNIAPPPKVKTRKTLTDEQTRWLGICTNPYAQRTLTSLVNDNAPWMTMEKHRQWMKQGAFAREYRRMMNVEVRSTEGEMVRRMSQRAMSGDTKSIEMFYRMQGEPLPTAIGTAGGNQVSLEAVLTALQKELEPEQMTRVAARLMNPDLPDILEIGAESAAGSSDEGEGVESV